MTDAFSRRQVLAYRATRHQFDRSAGKANDLDVLDLGIQHAAGVDSAAVALAARLAEGVDTSHLVGLWSFRGAPHLHRAADVRGLAAKLWPRSDSDGEARLAGFGPTLHKAGFPAREAIRLTAESVAGVLAGDGDEAGVTKGELSRAVTREIPDDLSLWCRGCKATHVNEQLLRVAVLPGGGRIVPGRHPVSFTAISGWRSVPDRPRRTGDVIRAYLHLHGPARPADAAGYLGSRATELEPLWPEDLVEVEADGRQAWIQADDLAELRRGEAPEVVRLLPPWDPYLQARDRDLLVPDQAQQKEVWKILGNPGVVLDGATLVGTWRPKKAGKKLKVAVSPFARLPKRVVAELEHEAQRVAVARGAESAELTVAG